MASRALLAFSIASFGGIEGFILSLPVGYLLAVPHAPKSEFRGLGILGSMLITGATCAAVIFTALLLLILVRYRDARDARLAGILATLMASVAAAIASGFILATFQGSVLWAIALSAIVLTAGLVHSLSRRESE